MLAGNVTLGRTCVRSFYPGKKKKKKKEQTRNKTKLGMQVRSNVRCSAQTSACQADGTGDEHVFHTPPIRSWIKYLHRPRNKSRSLVHE